MVQDRRQPAIKRHVAAAPFPRIKTLDPFDGTWPKQINRTQVQILLRLGFLNDKTNGIGQGSIGLDQACFFVRGHLRCVGEKLTA